MKFGFNFLFLPQPRLFSFDHINDTLLYYFKFLKLVFKYKTTVFKLRIERNWIAQLNIYLFTTKQILSVFYKIKNCKVVYHLPLFCTYTIFLQGEKIKKMLKFVQDLETNYTRVESILYGVRDKDVRKIHFNTYFLF